MNCLISSILRYLVLYHYFWYLLCLRINNYCFVSDYSTVFIGEQLAFLKTRQIQMWIFVNMIMEIDVWLVNKKQVSHIPAALWCLKSFTYIEGVFITNSKLKRVHLSLFHIHFVIDWHLLQKSIAKFKFSGKCSRLFIFPSVPGGRILLVEAILKLQNLSLISALFDWFLTNFRL